jgi:hypothetical protein
MAVRENGKPRLVPAGPEKCDEAEFIMLRDGKIAFEGNASELRAAVKRDPYIEAFLS